MNITLSRANLAPRRRSSLATLVEMFDLYRQRRALARLDNALLEDLGLSADEVRSETLRPMWDMPSHR